MVLRIKTNRRGLRPPPKNKKIMTISRVLVRYEEVPQELKHLVRDEGYEETYEGDERHLFQEFSLPELINLTPHAIQVVGYEEIPPSGLVARVTTKTVPSGMIARLPIIKTEFGEVTGLPEIAGVYFIVSSIVKAAANQENLLVPGELVRDDKGNITGCKSLSL